MSLEKLFTDVIQPLAALDGGAIALRSYAEGCVRIQFSKACIGCPGQKWTVEECIRPLVEKHLGRSVTFETEQCVEMPTGWTRRPSCTLTQD